MCDEYDDERTRVFWRIIAGRKDSEAAPTEPLSEVRAVVEPTGIPPAESPRPKGLLR